MTDKDKAADAADSAHVAQQQQGASDWPRPGDEGYVHPDGTPQAAEQLAANRRAAADRAAAGSSVHGAPLATPGPQAADVTAAAVERAEKHSGPTVEDAQRGVTEHVRQGLADAADDVDQADPDKGKRTATTDDGKTTR